MKNNYELREREILKKYYLVEGNVVHVARSYENLSDLVIPSGHDKIYDRVDIEELEFIDKQIDSIPSDYGVELDFYVENYDYEISDVLTSFHDHLELSNYDVNKQIRHKWTITAILMMIGLLILFIAGSIEFSGFFGESSGLTIMLEVLDIAGWVFIWQAMTVAFLEKLEFSVNIKRFKHKLKRINFYDKKKKLIHSHDTSERFEQWENENKTVKRSRYLLLISGTAITTIALYNLVNMCFNTIPLIHNWDEFLLNLIPVSLATLMIGVELLAGIGAICLYNNKKRFGVITFTLVVVHMSLLIITIILQIVMKTFVFDLKSYAQYGFDIMFFIGYFGIKKGNRKERVSVDLEKEKEDIKKALKEKKEEINDTMF